MWLNNEKKTFIWVTFCTADEKLCEYEKYKNLDKFIQSGIPDSLLKAGTARKQLEYLYSLNISTWSCKS